MHDAIVIDRLSKSYGHVRALDSVSVRVRPGERYGFIGRNGAGKTTTIRALLGMIRPDAGAIQVLGQPVGPHGRGPWRRVGHLVEQPAAYPELTVRQNLEIACRLHGLSDMAAVSRIIERLGLGPYASRKAHALSTGNLQRLGLARALVHEPELLILDEPTNGLDPAGVVEIRELLASLAHERGMTVFLSSHILTEVDRLATRIGIIHRGCVLEELAADQLAALRARRLEIEARHLAATIWGARREQDPSLESAVRPDRSAWGLVRNVGLVIGGLILLVAGAQWLVDGAMVFARALGVSELIIGLTIVAVGTSLPEIATSVLASLRGERDIAVGNVVGSNILNLLAVLGLTALIAPEPIAVPTSALAFDLPVLVAAAVACLPIFFNGKLIARWEGGLFLGYYVAYTIYLILATTRHSALPLFSAAMLFFAIPLTVVTIAVVTVRGLHASRQPA